MVEADVGLFIDRAFAELEAILHGNLFKAVEEPDDGLCSVTGLRSRGARAAQRTSRLQ